MYTLVVLPSISARFMGVLNSQEDLDTMTVAVGGLSDLMFNSLQLLVRHPVPGLEILVRTINATDNTVSQIDAYPGWDEIHTIIPLNDWRGAGIPPKWFRDIVAYQANGWYWFLDVRFAAHAVLRMQSVHWSACCTIGSVFGPVVDYLVQHHGRGAGDFIAYPTILPAPSWVSRMLDRSRSWRSFHELIPNLIRSWHTRDGRVERYFVRDLSEDPLFNIPTNQAHLFADQPIPGRVAVDPTTFELVQLRD